jgi:hypothetical protein
MFSANKDGQTAHKEMTMSPTNNSFQKYALEALRNAGVPCDTYGNWMIRLDTMTEIMSYNGVDTAVANRPKIVGEGYDTDRFIPHYYWTFEDGVTVYDIDGGNGYHVRSDANEFVVDGKSYEVGHEFIIK